MKPITLLITNSIATYGGAQPLRQVVLFVFVPDNFDKNTLGDIVAIRDENGIYLGSSYGGTKYTYGYDDTGFVTSIGYGGTAENASVTPLLQYSYYGDVYGASGSINSNQLYSKRYANGNIENYTYSHGSTYNGIVNKTQVDYKNN